MCVCCLLSSARSLYKGHLVRKYRSLYLSLCTHILCSVWCVCAIFCVKLYCILWCGLKGQGSVCLPILLEIWKQTMLSIVPLLRQFNLGFKIAHELHVHYKKGCFKKTAFLPLVCTCVLYKKLLCRHCLLWIVTIHVHDIIPLFYSSGCCI